MDRLAQYVPVLKWRQGEYQALSRLHDSIKDSIVPLLNIPPIEYDFEEKKMKKTVHAHVEPFPKRYSTKWGGRRAFIDFDDSLHDEFMDTGVSVISYVFDELHKLECSPVPVTGISRSKNYQAVIKATRKKISNGMALRVKLEELMGAEISEQIANLIQRQSLSYADVDLIIDVGTPKSFEPYGGFAKALASRIKLIRNLKLFRSFIIVATSIRMSEVKSPGAILARHEWGLYKAILGELSDIREPCFGDYCIEQPGYTSLDMRFIKPAGKVVYTTEDSWLIRKGGAFILNRSQMIQHCKDVIASDFYKGKKYSWGDEVIDCTANESKGCGNMTTWKQVGFSHHITFVTEQLSNLHGS